MHVGTSIFFQNHRRTRTDLEVYQNELRLADLAEPLGYESIWGVEHHFTDYTLCPDVVQFLTYMAGASAGAWPEWSTMDSAWICPSPACGLPSRRS